MSDTELSLLAGALLSLVFSYVPGLKDWFDKKESTIKRLIMAGALLVVSLLIFGTSCADLGFAFTVACDKEGVVGLVSIFIRALVANQATYLISPQPPEPDEEMHTMEKA